MNSNNNNGSSNNLRSARFQLEFEAASAERECRQSAWLAEDAFELYKRTCEEDYHDECNPTACNEDYNSWQGLEQWAERADGRYRRSEYLLRQFHNRNDSDS